MHELQERYARYIEEMVAVCHRLAADKYVTSQGGNVSMAVDRVSSPGLPKSNMLITPTKRFKGEIVFDDICIVDAEGKVLYAPLERKPTSELPFHKFIFQQRPDAVSIIHAHPLYTTSFALTREEPHYLHWPLLPETVVEVGPICNVPYAEPGTEKLADNFREFLPFFNAFLMENHGVTVLSGECPERTRQLVDIIEVTAAQVTAALARGAKIKPLSREAIQGLENTRRTRGLPLPGIPRVIDLPYCYRKAFQEIEKYQV